MSETALKFEQEKQEIVISPSGLMGLESAALYLGVGVNTMRWLRRTRKLPFVKIGAKVMVKQSAIDEYIEQQTDR